MKEATLPFISRLTSPNPVAIVCTPKPDGATNLATVSWWTTLSYNPEMIAFAMAKTAYSGERVRETGKVVLTVPTAPIAEEVLGCGTTTGRDTEKSRSSVSRCNNWKVAIFKCLRTAAWPSSAR